tara:strand:- start:152 stop:376 length:225 start_codon:yes stop_codon:yes gene_type:complete
MVLPEDSNNVLVDVLQQIADSLDKNTDILNRICNHYDSVVPVMKKNQEVVALANEDNRSTLDKMYDGIFSTNES